MGQVDLSDKQIIDFGIYGPTDMYWTLSLDTSGVVPASYIVTFKQDGTITGSIEVIRTDCGACGHNCRYNICIWYKQPDCVLLFWRKKERYADYIRMAAL